MARKTWIVLPLLFLLASSAVPAQSDVVFFRSESAVHLRWKGVRSAGLEGYHLYRRAAADADWKRITDAPLRRVTDRATIRRLAGHKVGLYLGLFGVADSARDLTAADYDRVLAGGGDIAFIEVMSVVNPEFGLLLGEIHADSSAPAGVDVRYRVTAIVSGAEREVATTGAIRAGIADEVPAVEIVEGRAGDGEATIVWEKNEALLREGRIVTWSVRRAEQILGPYEPVNVAGILPITVSSDGKVQNEGRGELVDRFLENGRTYYYQVSGVNPFGFEGAPSATIEITPRDTRAPLPPRSIVAEPYGGGVRLTWETPSRPAVRGVEIFRATRRSGAYRRVIAGAAGTPKGMWLDVDVAEGSEYFYVLRSLGENGTPSAPSDTVSFYLTDRTPPAVPRGVVATGAPGRITVRWEKNGEPDILGYEVERASDDAFAGRFLMTDTPTVAASFVDSLPAGSETTYGYVVTAIDRAWNRSAPSAMTYARLPDAVPPERPIVTSLTVSGGTVRLAWTAGIERDLSHYRVYRSATDTTALRPVAEPRTNRHEERLEKPGRYLYAVTAVDSAGNESPRSKSFSLDHMTDRRPAAPSTASVEAKEGHLLVKWTSGAADVAGFVVTRVHVATGRSLVLAQLKKTDREYRDGHADRAAEYVYRVQAHDEEWRTGEAVEARWVPR